MAWHLNLLRNAQLQIGNFFHPKSFDIFLQENILWVLIRQTFNMKCQAYYTPANCLYRVGGIGVGGCWGRSAAVVTNMDTFANSVDPDEMAQNELSHQDLHSLPFYD